ALYRSIIDPIARGRLQSRRLSLRPRPPGYPLFPYTTLFRSDYDAGTVIVEVTPATSVGKKPRINVTPETTYIRFDNHAVTGPSYAEENIQVIRKHGRNILIIEGTIPLTSKTIKEWIAVWEPTLYALDVFEHALK